MVSGRVLRRGLTLLVRSSPRAVAGLVIVQVVTGLAPAVVVAAGATLLDNASTAAGSAAARRATVLAGRYAELYALQGAAVPVIRSWR